MESKQTREFNDEEDFELIMRAHRFKGFNKGAKQLKMTFIVQLSNNYESKED